MSDLPKIDCRADHWQIVHDILQKHLAKYEVWAFGSRAKWTAQEYSDLDLAVITTTPLSLEILASVSDDLSESDLPWRVDVIDWASTSASFREIIAQDKVVVQQKIDGLVENWKLVRLDDISEVIDSRHKTPEYSNQGFPMVRVVDVNGGRLELEYTKKVSTDIYADFSKGRDPEIGDLVISRVGSYGNVSYASSLNKFCLGQNTALIIPNNKDRFLYYALISPQIKLQIEEMVVGAVQKTISLKNIKNLNIPNPPESIRIAISNILSSIDDKITLNRQINQTLEQMAQALFKSWFVDFDPVIDNALDAGNPIPEALQWRATLRESVRKQDNFKPLPENIRASFPSEFEESELGWIPKGWAVSNVGKEFNITMGQSPPGSAYNEAGEGMPFFQGKTDFGFRFPSNRIYCTDPKRIAYKNDTLISVRAPVGSINIAAEDCIIGRGLAAARHKSKSVSFTFYTMNNLAKHFEVFEGEGTVFGSINQKDL
ncbi:hypothetical protein AwWohl_13790 [Gammaproteobacteria bacterium]|nr:hypothetical protein AwWohl_13790 [Gammaproteobacteria bacterium]